MITQKWCPKNKHFADVSEFGKNPKKKGGLQTYCRECRKELYRENATDILRRQKIYAEKNREKINARKRQYNNNKYWADPEKARQYNKIQKLKHQDQIKKNRREYYEKNKQNLLKKNKQHYINNKPAYDAKRAVYRDKNREMYRISWIRRRVLMKSAQGTFTLQQWQQKIQYFGNCCYLCGESLENKTFHAEHRIPLSRGGTNWIANIAPACVKCNLSKHDKTEKEYREWLASL